MSTARLQPRRILSFGILTLAAVSCALMATAAAPSDAAAKDLITAHSVRSISCVSKRADTVSAQVKLTMRVVNYHGVSGLDWADHMEAKARLEPTSAGLNFTRKWVSSKTPDLTQDKRHSYDFALVTDNVRPDASWRVHIKLVWHRSFPAPNITKDLYRPFNASCAGSSLGASPQAPSAGGGS